MMLEALRAKVRGWDSQNPNGEPIADGKYGNILNQIEYHANNEWRVYLPAEHTDFNSNYMERLAAWIGNLPSEDEQKLLLEYALQISFFSHEDFVALYRTALNREVFQWVASEVDFKLDQDGGQGFHDEIYKQIHQHTWFCPVTDSMDINEFYKVNHLAGISYRPGFSALRMMAEYPDKQNSQIVDIWSRYMVCPNGDPRHPAPALERLVLLEDIVGSGNQCLKAVQWALKLDKPVLFIPLILCPNGAEVLRAEERKWNGKLTVRPVIELSRGDLLGPESKGQNAWPIARSVELLARQASNGMNAFGYETTGCSLTTFSNTPDNTLPIVHSKLPSGNWKPLFPRVHRGD